jgi:hypothetical protein
MITTRSNPTACSASDTDRSVSDGGAAIIDGSASAIRSGLWSAEEHAMKIPNRLDQRLDRAAKRNRPPTLVARRAPIVMLVVSAVAAVFGFWPVAWLLAVTGWALFAAWALYRQAIHARQLGLLGTRITNWQATGQTALAELQADVELARAATKVETQEMRDEIQLLRQRLRAIREEYGHGDDPAADW